MQRSADARRDITLYPIFAVLLLAVLCHTGSAALALDGVVEINQVWALHGSVTATDTPGFPVTIDREGSYRLSGNLDVTTQPSAQDVTAISITASHVTLDLNGFTVAGPTICSGTPPATSLSCAPTGSGIGIDTSASADDVVIHDGVVRGMGSRGIYLRRSGRVQNVEARGNGSVGIAVDGMGALLLRNHAWSNGNKGIVAGAGALVRDCVLSGNNNRGLEVGLGSLVENNHIEGNRVGGAFVNAGSIVRGNNTQSNAGTGLAAGDGVTVVSNMVSGGAAGVDVSSGSNVSSNTITANSGYAIVFTNSNSGYGQNVLTGNKGGVEIQATNGGLQLSGNFCGSDATCP